MHLIGRFEINRLLLVGLGFQLLLVIGCTREIPVGPNSTPVNARPSLKALPLAIIANQYTGARAGALWKPTQQVLISPDFHPDSLKYTASISPSTDGNNRMMGFGPIPMDSSQLISVYYDGLPIIHRINSGDTTYYMNAFVDGSKVTFKAIVFADSGDSVARTYTLTLTN